MQDYVIGVDIGGTNIKAGAVNHKGEILARKRISTEAGLGIESILDRLNDLVSALKHTVTDYRLKGAGFGVPGAVRWKDGIVTQAPNVPAFNGQPIRKLLQERLELDCYIENDANALALGEMWMGAGRGHNHICCLTLGTGVGGGVIIEGELLHGADGMAAELGHIAVKSDGPKCNCGSYGCLESYASATGILRMYSEAVQNEPASLPPAAEITTAFIYEQAKNGDVVCRRILERAGEFLGVGLASLVNMFNPEVLIIGGGVAAAWDLMIPPAVQVMKRRAFQAPCERVKVVRAEREDDAGIYGAAYMTWDSLQKGGAQISHERSITPWGFWQVVEEGNDYKVKRLYIHPGHRLSYQKHQQREETWMIASGEALIVIDGSERRLRAGETIHIPKTSAHRIGNPADAPLIFFEVQRGTYFGEDDIERLQDDYKRS